MVMMLNDIQGIETDGLRECRDIQLRLEKKGVAVPLDILKK